MAYMREEWRPYALWGTSPTRSQQTSQSRPAKGRADTRWHHFSALNSSNCNDSKSLRNWHRAFLRNLKSLLSSMQDYLLSCKETRRKRQTSSATYPCIEADWGQQVWGRRHLLFSQLMLAFLIIGCGPATLGSVNVFLSCNIQILIIAAAVKYRIYYP